MALESCPRACLTQFAVRPASPRLASTCALPHVFRWTHSTFGSLQLLGAPPRVCMWPQHCGSAEAEPAARCMPGRQRAGPGSCHGGDGGFPSLALGCIAYSCGGGVRRPSRQV